jgi:glycosyltransferase involved in cell wall biosynthesis
MSRRRFLSKVVITHTDFRIYWPARIQALQEFLEKKNIVLEIIEIAGEGSPYQFVTSDKSGVRNWHILFPSEKMEDISPSRANKALHLKLNELDADIVMAGAIAFPSGAASIQWATQHNRRVIIFDNARLLDVPRNWLINQMKMSIYRFVDAILCPSPATKPSFQYWGVSDEQIFYGVNCVDNNFFVQTQTTHNLVLPDRYFLAVGRLVPKKNFQLLLRAYSHYLLNCCDNPYELVIVGEGADLITLKEFATKNNISTIHFHPFASQDKLREYYSRAGLFVLPSKYGETWGLVVNEAMATGLPVLVSKQCGCASTLVFPGENGYIFDPLNVNELTDCFIKFHQLSETEKKQFGRVSIEIIGRWGLQQFCRGSWDAIQYVYESPKRKGNLFDWFILLFWKGRYRPT